jgi:3-oxoacyl-[acyl-carrier protein] reductase
MDLGLAGKRVFVAGASRGIGLAIARAFLREGAKVALAARDRQRLEQAVRPLAEEHGSGQVLAHPMDCAEASAWPAAIAALRSAWQGLDVAIANVGDGQGPRDALPGAERFAAAWRANFSAAEATARATLELLQASSGCLLFVSSIAGLEAIGAPTDYSVAKTALVALTKHMARRLAPGVRVNCLAPGNIRFPGGSWEKKIQADPERIAALIESTVPMKRFGTPEEMADAALFLCSARAAFITGACLVADGGQTVSFP